MIMSEFKIAQAIADSALYDPAASDADVSSSKEVAIAHFKELMLSVKTMEDLLLKSFLVWLLAASPMSALEVMKVHSLYRYRSFASEVVVLPLLCIESMANLLSINLLQHKGNTNLCALSYKLRHGQWKCLWIFDVCIL
jgi:hypothetical protein